MLLGGYIFVSVQKTRAETGAYMEAILDIICI